jgi:hypothetical protein
MQRGGVEQQFAVLIDRLLDGVSAMAWLRAVLSIDRLPSLVCSLAQSGHRLRACL